MTLEEYCIEMDMENILAEWDEPLNGGYSPRELSAFSHCRLWWHCKNGHLWQAEVKDRVSKHSGCPYCAGKLPIKGVTDLATLFPGVAKEWHPEKNKGISPADVTAGTDKIYWWLCKNGHEWKAAVGNRALKGNACPYCSGKRAWPGYNDLATLYPELMKEWCYEKNEGIDPKRLRPHSGKRAYWICADGHIWSTCIFNRTSAKRCGCPVCAGNVKNGEKSAVINIGQLRMEAKSREKKKHLYYTQKISYKDTQENVQAQ
ncbi:MAG: zinc-ribbon domain-containing protein [Clostridium sp.]|nr:zinc-ribbon domain-containing protein [Clostridium sp.]MCM1399890.1 zinc-ribbon domain-containing protein [Clostridium sp.]MCM1460693.1 zinc-ribbon domain-containing protein [Bacteroides sp.]